MSFILCSLLLLAQETPASQAATLLQTWYQETSQVPYRASVEAKILQVRKQTSIQQTIQGSLVFQDAGHAKGTLDVLTSFPIEGSQEEKRDPVSSTMVAVMDGTHLWTHIQMTGIEYENVMQADLASFAGLMHSQYSGVLGLSLPFLANPQVLYTILADHDLKLRTSSSERVIEGEPSRNLLGSFNLLPITEGRTFTLTFPSEGFYPMKMEINAPEGRLVSLTIDHKKPLDGKPDFSFVVPEGVTPVDALKPYRRFIQEQFIQ